MSLIVTDKIPSIQYDESRKRIELHVDNLEKYLSPVFDPYENTIEGEARWIELFLLIKAIYQYDVATTTVPVSDRDKTTDNPIIVSDGSKYTISRLKHGLQELKEEYDKATRVFIKSHPTFILVLKQINIPQDIYLQLADEIHYAQGPRIVKFISYENNSKIIKWLVVEPHTTVEDIKTINFPNAQKIIIWPTQNVMSRIIYSDGTYPINRYIKLVSLIYTIDKRLIDINQTFEELLYTTL